jgi:hypothetical protein
MNQDAHPCLALVAQAVLRPFGKISACYAAAYLGSGKSDEACKGSNLPQKAPHLLSIAAAPPADPVTKPSGLTSPASASQLCTLVPACQGDGGGRCAGDPPSGSMPA